MVGEAGMVVGDGDGTGSGATAPAMTVILGVGEDEIRGEPGGLVRRADGGPAEPAHQPTAEMSPQAPGRAKSYFSQ